MWLSSNSGEFLFLERWGECKNHHQVKLFTFIESSNISQLAYMMNNEVIIHIQDYFWHRLNVMPWYRDHWYSFKSHCFISNFWEVNNRRPCLLLLLNIETNWHLLSQRTFTGRKSRNTVINTIIIVTNLFNHCKVNLTCKRTFKLCDRSFRSIVTIIVWTGRNRMSVYVTWETTISSFIMFYIPTCPSQY